MSVIAGREKTFDTVASTYEKMRPRYPAELYDAIFAYVPVGSQSNAVEIGIGAGQATLPVLETGCRVTSAEIGENFAKICAEKFCEYPKFSVITGRFEEIPFEGESCDLVYSASAFHWIPEEIGYKKVYRMLKSGGAFARFANHPFMDKGRPEMIEKIQQAYREYYASFYHKETSAPLEYTQEQARERALIAEKYGFVDCRYALFSRTRSFTAQEYVALLDTYSDHIAIDEPIRSRFFAEIKDTIEAYGGTITLYDTLDLQLARKP